jgi:tryptophan synthase alpha chain
MTVPPFAAASGITRMHRAFEDAALEQRAALVPYIVAGRPGFDECIDLIVEIAAAGADVIELGVPFSDPLADGEVIRNATRRALDDGMNVARCLELVRQARRRGVDVPIVLMGYVNPLLAYGIEGFCADATDSGVDGLIVPDARSLDELESSAREHGLAMTMLATPLSSDERIAEVAARSTGFLYAVASTGTTGARSDVAASTIELLERARRLAGKTPVAVGFGVATAEHVTELAPHVDGVIVGSALVALIEHDPSAAVELVRSMRAATAR